jgi:hypothetical protein
MVNPDRHMIRQVPCPKCGARAGAYCGPKKRKRNHNERLQAAQKYFNKGARSVAEHDNTNRGAAFKPFPQQQMILQGKINTNGQDANIVLVKTSTKAGKPLIEVYEKRGVLFENNKEGNEGRPDYTGPWQEDAPTPMRLAAWRKNKDGNPYMSMEVSEQQQKNGVDFDKTKSVPDLSLKDDDIPF